MPQPGNHLRSPAVARRLRFARPASFRGWRPAAAASEVRGGGETGIRAGRAPPFIASAGSGSGSVAPR